jgi:stearoyl-CoA desaturase (Delta-9 desaturase)
VSQVASVSSQSVSRPPSPERFHQVSALIRTVNLLAVVLPLVGFIAAMAMLWGYGINGTILGVFLGMYFLTGWGVTIGFHRLFTHRSFETNRVVTAALGVLGSMAVEGPLLRWAAQHRRHHQHSDRPEDPHSPHLHGEGWRGLFKGLWHAHMGWLFKPDSPGLSRYVGDLRRDPLLRKINALFPLWVGLGLLIPAVLGGVLTLSWSGALLGFLWGGLARIFLVHHVTWSVNSICHVWGAQPFRGNDQSRNNVIVGVLAMGEGWHNNHHAFPNSARHGLQWWQVDVSYWVIRGLSLLGLAWNVKAPASEAIAAKQARQAQEQA